MKKLFDLIFGKSTTGALIDNRPAEDKQKDISFEEIVATANTVKWEEKTSYRTFPVFNQNGTYACGAYSLKKHLGVLHNLKHKDFIYFSVQDIYQRRFNKPSGGMALWDMAKIAKEGVTLQELTQGAEYKDVDLDSYPIEDYKREIGKVFKIEGEPIYIDGGDFETIASVIQTTGKSVIGTMFFLYDEWSKFIPIATEPKLQYLSNSALRHFINFVDFTIYKGKKYLVAEDSSHFGGFSTRLVSEEFLKKRNYLNMYLMNFKFDTKPKPRYNGSITSLQACLQSIGIFPTNVSFVESYGPLTRKSVKEFKLINGLPNTDELDYQTVSLLKKVFP